MLKAIFDRNLRILNSAEKVTKKVNELENQVKELSYEQMQENIKKIQKEFTELVEKVPENDKLSLTTFNRSADLPSHEQDIQEKLFDVMPLVYAYQREILRRKFNRRHYDVQITAGAVLAEGQRLIEAKTGEGKTQIFQLPTILYSLVGRGAHLVTVNDYLAKRDGEYIGHVAAELGLTVGIITPAASYKFIPDNKLKEIRGEEIASERESLGELLTLSDMKELNLVECSKHDAYRCDITYGTNNEFGFDYLRDNMSWNLKDIVQRELYYCVVDEADSILIDEARTPLIISSPGDASSDKYVTFARAVRNLEEEKDYVIDYKTRTATLTEEGIDRSSSLLGVDNIWEDYSMAHHLENALKAKALFIKDDHYIVRNNEVLIVDQFTGRVLPGRRYSEGLHQAIEAKEGVDIQQESRTFATISFQNLFRLYKFLLGGSATIDTEKEEFFKIYSLDTVVVPTNRPVVRDDRRDRIYQNQDAKFKAVAREVKEKYEKGQPVLVGTTSIDKSDIVSAELTKLGVPHQVLNAKYHEKEAQIVAKAGQKGAVTVATNMAGRGTDIPLGEGVRELGGLAVIGTERHEARRIDNQLRGRAGRQGDPGDSRFYVAMDDMIMKMLGGEVLERLMGMINVPEGQAIEMGMISKRIEDAQKKVEWANFDSRKKLVEYDDVMNQQREIFYVKRRKFLTKSESALGNFFINSRFKTIREIPEDQKDLFSEKINSAKEEMKKDLRDLINEEIENMVAEQFSGKEKIQEDEYKSLSVKYLDLYIDQDLADSMSVQINKLNDEVFKNINEKNEEDVVNFLQDNSEKMIVRKLSEFKDEFYNLYKMVLLEAYNTKWVDHLEYMQDIREGVGLQGYAQRDPLIEYKSMAFAAFDRFLIELYRSVARRILKVRIVNAPSRVNLQTNEDEIQDINTGDREFLRSENRSSENSVNASNIINKIKEQAEKEQQVMQKASGNKIAKNSTDEKVGRNDPCPCGSGKKYKKCGLINSPEHQKNMSS